MYKKQMINAKNVTIYAIIFGISIWLRQGFPIFGLPGAGHDDGYYQKMIINILSGEWLGAYSQLTLIKSPFYGFFGASAFLLGIPLKIAEHILYLAASLFASKYVGEITESSKLSIVTFLLLAFNPILWTMEISRLYRDGIYLSVCLILFVQICKLSFEKFEKGEGIGVRYAARVAAVIGVYYLTREEAIWMVPSCVIIIILSFARVNKMQRKMIAKKILFGSTLIGAFSFLILSIFSITNYYNYKVFTIEEQHESSFLSAYGSLARIEAQERRLVPVTKEARKIAYLVSPAAKELEQHLEGELGKSWTEHGCQQLTPPICDDIGGGWFMWALRDAVAGAGHYTDGQQAKNFYDRIASEIDKACSEKLIKCNPKIASMLQALSLDRFPELIQKFFKVVLMELDWSLVKVAESHQSIGGYDAISRTKDVAGAVLDSSEQIITLKGWEASTGKIESIFLQSPDGRSIVVVPDMPAPDIERIFPNLNSARFSYVGLCTSPCKLIVNGKLVDPKAGYGEVIDGVNIHFDNFSTGSNNLNAKYRALKVSTAKTLMLLLKSILCIFFFIAFLGATWHLILDIRSRIASQISIVQVSILVAILSRAFILAYIDTTFFPAINVLYMLPVSVFVILFVAIGCYQLTYLLKSKYERLV
jgi:hypothetical protein